MAAVHHAKVTELLSLYGIYPGSPERNQPHYGSSYQLPLTNNLGEYIQQVTSDAEGNLTLTYEPKTEVASPTPHNLAHHLGYMQSVQYKVTSLLRKSRGTITGKDLLETVGALETQAQRYFFSHVIEPAREEVQQLPHACYLYCVPSVTTSATEADLLTGKQIYHLGSLVLTLLPTTPGVALASEYDEADIALLARQVVWVVKKLCGLKVVQTPEQLVKALDRWPTYVDPLSMHGVYHHLQEAHPYLLTAASTQALLP